MGKRSTGAFERVARDYYKTPAAAVAPLLPHLSYSPIIEPCAGDGALIDALNAAGHEVWAACDIEPQRAGIATGDAMNWQRPLGIQYHTFQVVTNPPWSRAVLHPMIAHLASQHPTWMLFDADWPHTRQSAPFMHLLRKVVSVGRIKWIPDSPFTGKDNCCWYMFDASSDAPTQFIGRGGR